MSSFFPPDASRHLSILAKAREHCSPRVGGMVLLEESWPTWPAKEMRDEVSEMGTRDMWE